MLQVEKLDQIIELNLAQSATCDNRHLNNFLVKTIHDHKANEIELSTHTHKYFRYCKTGFLREYWRVHTKKHVNFNASRL